VTNPVALFQSGDLSGALAMATDAVRSRPTDVPARSLLCEFLCYAGELERAEKQLDAVLQSDPQTMNGVSLLKHLIRSELSRREVYRLGRVPDFVAMPTEPQKKRLEAMLCLRTGHVEDARRLCDEAAEMDPELSGQLNDQPFAGVRDLDDLLGPTLEVFTATGKYYWIGFEQITSLEFNPVEHLTDMLWRSASIETVGDVNGRIHVPALYEGSEASSDQRIRIGRATEWVQATSNAPVRGSGQREFLVGDDVVSIMEIRKLTIHRNDIA